MRGLPHAAHMQHYATHNVLSHGASNTTWTAVLVGLIPILGLAAIGILIYVLVRRPDEEPDA
jgi:hypothetical protein